MMLQTRAVRRPRQSRRSACDRCRTYKLRCERSLAGRAECERCARTPGVTCTTTTPSRPPTNTQTSHSHRLISRPFPDDRSAKTPSSCLGPALHTPPPTLNHGAGTQNQEHGRPITSYHARGTTASNQLMDFGLSTPISDICDTTSMDFALPDLNFPEDGCFPSPSGINDFVSLDDATVPTMTSPSAPSCSSSTLADAPGQQEPNTMLDLLELCSNLVEDHETLTTFHGNEDFSQVPNMPLNRLLDNTVHFSNLLKDISLNDAPAQQPVAQPEPQRPNTYIQILPKPMTGIPLGPQPATEKPRTPSIASSTSTASPTPRPNTTRDIVLTTTLITTYITLIRSWRQVYLNVYNILLSDENNNRTKLASLTSSLPTLQLGGLHVLQNNPAMQLAILLETSASLIEGIEDFLGISDGNKSCLNMMSDPGAVSIREALLSQETLRVYSDGRGAGLGGQTWRELVAEVKNRLGLCFR